MSTFAQDLLGPQQKEGVKAHFEYDGFDRMIESYTAPSAAYDGDPCIKTTYTYVLTKSLVENMKEEVSALDSSLDI